MRSIYVLKQLIMYLINNKTTTVSIKIHEAKSVISLLFLHLLDMYPELSISERIRVIHEALNLRVLDKRFLQSEEFFHFAEFFNAERLKKLVDPDLTNTATILTSIHVYTTLRKTYNAEAVIEMYGQICEEINKRKDKNEMRFFMKRICKNISFILKICKDEGRSNYTKGLEQLLKKYDHNDPE